MEHQQQAEEWEEELRKQQYAEHQAQMEAMQYMELLGAMQQALRKSHGDAVETQEDAIEIHEETQEDAV